MFCAAEQVFSLISINSSQPVASKYELTLFKHLLINFFIDTCVMQQRFVSCCHLLCVVEKMYGNVNLILVDDNNNEDGQKRNIHSSVLTTRPVHQRVLLFLFDTYLRILFLLKIVIKLSSLCKVCGC